MNSRERLLTALDGGRPDRLPVTTHHVMPYFLDTYLDGISDQAFFDRFGLDPTNWLWDVKPDSTRGEYWVEVPGYFAGAGGRLVASDQWRITARHHTGGTDPATRYDIATPDGSLSMVLRHGTQTDWVVERLLKEKGQFELIERYAPVPLCDVAAINRQADATAGRGILRGAVSGFQIYGQPGCWQDAAVLFGIEQLIMETHDDPAWVHALLGVLRDRKLAGVASMAGARFDVIELGGGDASSTVISPKIFEEFVAPYDADLIAAAHRVGLRVVYHTCGGMMPLLELIAGMNPDAMETFTPPSLGGDADLREAKSRVGDRVCLIGGFDQWRFFKGCTPEETRRAVRQCFDDAGEGGGYILAPSDHFFDAEVGLIGAFAEEARACRYAG